MANHIDDKFFPVPSHDGSAKGNPLLPHNRPGATPASTVVLRKILTDNHHKWHIFFNDKGFHKCVPWIRLPVIIHSISLPSHIVHAVLSLWCLGADGKILEASYERQSSYQRPQFPSPNPITHQTWKNHLGDERCVRSLYTSSL